MQEKEHVLGVLQNTKKAARNEDIIELKTLSDQTIHTASIEQDSDNVIVAVVIYALSKLIERKSRYMAKDYREYINHYTVMIDELIDSIKKNDPKMFQQHLKEMMSGSGKLSEHLRRTIEDLFRKARINKASKVYEHGLSMGTTAKLLDISLWELAEYSGQTGIADVPLTQTMDVKKRIKIAMEIFE